MNKDGILEEIRRTALANNGISLGQERFETETGIRISDWYGKFWTRWSEAVREAGFEPNRMNEAYDLDHLLNKLVVLTRTLGRVPVRGDLMMAARNDSTSPSKNVFNRLGQKSKRASFVIAYCENNPGNDDVASLWKLWVNTKGPRVTEETDSSSLSVGYVYLLKHGSRREYKIGRTNNPLRREGEIGIQLPERLEPEHYIKTDDPAGVERYWHTRFADKRKEGEWFALTAQDVRAFKRWKRIY